MVTVINFLGRDGDSCKYSLSDNLNIFESTNSSSQLKLLSLRPLLDLKILKATKLKFHVLFVLVFPLHMVLHHPGQTTFTDTNLNNHQRLT